MVKANEKYEIQPGLHLARSTAYEDEIQCAF
jgi:hypothetical protein